MYRVILILLLLLCPIYLWAVNPTLLNTNAVNVQASNTYSSNAFTVNAGGSNTIAIIPVIIGNLAGATISSVTLGGVTATSCGATADENYTGVLHTYASCFYILSPASGANQVLAINASVGVTYIGANVVVFQDVNQTTPFHNYTTALISAGNARSITISSATTELSFSVIAGDAAVGTGTTNQTSDGTANTGLLGTGSDHATTPASSVTHTWSTTNACALVGASLENVTPSGGGGPNTSSLTTMGTGK